MTEAIVLCCGCVRAGFTLRNAYYKPSITKTDVAIFVSPEFSIDYYRDFIRRSTPACSSSSSMSRTWSSGGGPLRPRAAADSCLLPAAFWGLGSRCDTC